VKEQATPAAEVRKILYVEKRKAHAACSGTRKPGGPLNQVGNWVLQPFCMPEERDVSDVQADISWEGEVSPWPIITFWDLLQSVLHYSGLTDFLEWLTELMEIFILIIMSIAENTNEPTDQRVTLGKVCRKDHRTSISSLLGTSMHSVSPSS
jgi:hypothetical protein